MHLVETQQVSLHPFLPSFIQRFATTSLLELMSGPSTMNQYRHLLIYAIPGLTPQQRRHLIQRLPTPQRALHLQPGALPRLIFPQGFLRLLTPAHSQIRPSLLSTPSSLTFPTHSHFMSPTVQRPAVPDEDIAQRDQDAVNHSYSEWTNTFFSLFFPSQNSSTTYLEQEPRPGLDEHGFIHRNDGNYLYGQDDDRLTDLEEDDEQDLLVERDPSFTQMHGESSSESSELHVPESISQTDDTGNLVLVDAFSTMAQTYSTMASNSITQVSHAIVESAASVVIPTGLYLSSLSTGALVLRHYSSTFSRIWMGTYMGNWMMHHTMRLFSFASYPRQEDTTTVGRRDSFIVTGLYSTAIVGGIGAGTMWWIRNRFRTKIAKSQQPKEEK
jgi:hypothetical protein